VAHLQQLASNIVIRRGRRSYISCRSSCCDVYCVAWTQLCAAYGNKGGTIEGFCVLYCHYWY